MATLPTAIVQKFLLALQSRKEVDASTIDNLRDLLNSGKRVKSDDLVKIFTILVGGDAE